MGVTEVVLSEMHGHGVAHKITGALRKPVMRVSHLKSYNENIFSSERDFNISNCHLGTHFGKS